MRKENSTNTINDNLLQNFCKAHSNLSQITGRWKVSLIFLLKDTTKSYAELKSALPLLSDRILSKQLKELQSDLIVENQKDKSQSIYNLSAKGEKILSLLEFINQLALP